MSGIVIHELTKRYGDATVLDALDLTVREGEFLTLLGPSGCGKTTTLRAIAGLEPPDGGTIRIGDTVVTSVADGIEVPPNKRSLGMVFQSYAIWPHMSVFDNVAFPLRRQGVGVIEVRQRVLDSLEIVGLVHAARRSATALSGGQQQRVALARAMVADPKVLLFDEPLSNLDAQLRISMRDEIQRVRSDGQTSIYVTHDQSEAFALSDRIAVMLGGIMVQLDTPAAVMSRPVNAEVARFLGVENLFEGTVRGLVRSGTGSGSVLAVDVPSLKTVLSAVHPETVPAGAAVTVGIRAGAVMVAGAGAPGDVPPNTSTGRVVQSTFLGEGVQYRMAVGSAHVLARTFSGVAAPTLPPGASLSVTLPPEAVAVFTS
ncbi:ABC transporter ATP-binding protein [Nakamurella leprariae]|uniref:ABC transporter ATP-binding protein n=1 Tax=Nakamurella leprariae TaxID=2803911 RepID=A0A938YFR4_9ACTN|nr:ABC transporter ATP-binding protein [Nakamurella leprariae]MBM9466998.1 ABC transporter ATP-binding protein [Nakamurella leprariae]